MPIAAQNNNETFKTYKSEAIKAAIELGYDVDVIEKLNKAKN